MKRRIARLLDMALPCLWMRGFLPAILVLLLGLFSTGTWILWTASGTIGPGTAPVRAAIGKGVIMVNWGWPGNARWIGGRHWTLGVMSDGAGTVKPGWIVDEPLWSASRLKEINLGLEIHPNHIKIPLLWAWAFFALPPAAWILRKRLMPREGACRHCGYDMHGLAREICPECGRAAKAEPPRRRRRIRPGPVAERQTPRT